MKAILIDVQGVHEVEMSGDTLDEMYRLLGCRCVTSGGYIEIPGHDAQAVWADDEGLFSTEPVQCVTLGKWYPQPLVGNLLVTGLSENGETIATSLTAEQVKAQISRKGFRMNGGE